MTEAPAGKAGQRWVAINESGRRIGATHHNAKLTDQQVDDIRSRHEDLGQNPCRIARELGISRRTVRNILSYQRRAQTPADWKKLSD